MKCKLGIHIAWGALIQAYKREVAEAQERVQQQRMAYENELTELDEARDRLQALLEERLRD